MGIQAVERKAAAVALLATVAVMMAGSAAAQGTSILCGPKLVPCQKFLNSTKPSEECCESIKDVVTNDLQCLCNVFKAPEILKALGIDLQQALTLPTSCGINLSPSSCKDTDAAPPSGSIAPSGISPGPADANNSGNGLTKLGLSSLVSLFIIWSITMK